jgi:hypothetical protein
MCRQAASDVVTEQAARQTFFGRVYIEALKNHHPHLVSGAAQSTVDRVLHVGIIDKWMQNMSSVGVDASDRLQRIIHRPWKSARSAWIASGAGNSVRHAGVHYSYKGLINLEPAIELVLYSSLIWEVRPRTIIEFGSLQGGSALWFADQLEALCGAGVVHSFELNYDCISKRLSSTT